MEAQGSLLTLAPVYKCVYVCVCAVCQQELLHSQEEVQRLLDKMEELTQERGEMVSHRVHSRLLKIADERADEAEKRVHELEAEVK